MITLRLAFLTGILMLAGLPPLVGAEIPAVSLRATVTTDAKTGEQGAIFTFERTGDTALRLTVTGDLDSTTTYGLSYSVHAKPIVFEPGARTLNLPISLAGDHWRGTKNIRFTLKPDSTYVLSGPASATATIVDEKGEALYVASLRPEMNAGDSTAYGTATLHFAPGSDVARVTVTYSNLTSPLVTSHLKLGVPGQEGAYLMNIPGDQPVTFDWDLHPTGQLGTADLQQALDQGLVYVAIDSRRYPAGELRGPFIRSTGSVKFSAPPAPPALPPGAPTPADAARFLTQATFGPTRDEIDHLARKNLAGWIEEQMALPPSSHLDATRADYQAFPPGGPKPRIGPANRQAAWWKIAVTAPDQLRQRVAFALSEIFVASDVDGTLAGNPEALAAYNDLLARDAFGSFRQLLQDVTLSPVMGIYLSHLRSAKPDVARNISPDENYAREVMQLFTIGLNQLQPDGTLRLGPDGLPIPTYDQKTIVETARVFTGWSFYSAAPKPNFRGARANYFAPMMLYPEFHDDGAKTIIGGLVLPAGQGGARDLRDELDALANHPNAAPFICRQLIQRLVTSNPSPGYVFRVAQVFAKNGNGERGDLGAVVRAILLDYEARSPLLISNLGYGKLKEPLIRLTALLRAFDASAKTGRYNISNPEGALGEAALRSPTVFNFFEPDYVLPGTLAAAGLHAPEYQIFTDTTAITVPNELQRYLYTPNPPPEATLALKLDPLLPLARTPDPLLDYLSLVFCGGGMPADFRQHIADALAALPPATSDLDRIRCALQLTISSTAAAIQR
jgi:uncharacterized protein (DUF1800 family)